MLVDCLQPDPVPPKWLDSKLPNTWPDRLNLIFPRDLLHFIKAIIDPAKHVEIPDDLPGRAQLPHYLLQEFHHLPNGNYSHKVAKGYIRGFEIAMLGHMRRIRKKIAHRLQHCRSALDVGCGGGGLAGTLQMIGIPEVWGLEPSPYLLQLAAGRYPEVHFLQGLAENLPFREERLEAIGACFLFHELPETTADQTLREFHRVLAKGGLVAIAEPSPMQLYETSSFNLLRRYGLLAPYFKWLARFVYEPYIDQWHQRNYSKWFAEFGFKLLCDEVEFPARHFLMQKI